MASKKLVRCRLPTCDGLAVWKHEWDWAHNRFIYRCARHPFKRSSFLWKTEFNEKGFAPAYGGRRKPYAARKVAPCFGCGKEQYKGRYKMCLCAWGAHRRRGLV